MEDATKDVMMLTQEGYDKLEGELDYLKTTKRREVAERIKVAIAFGDLSENAEYDEAKNEQAFMEGRILQLEAMLRRAQVVDEASLTNDEVGIGSTVKVLDVEFDEEDTYTIVGASEANVNENKISNESPVGKALIGSHKGDTVEVEAPDGAIKLKVIDIRRDK